MRVALVELRSRDIQRLRGALARGGAEAWARYTLSEFAGLFVLSAGANVSDIQRWQFAARVCLGSVPDRRASE